MRSKDKEHKTAALQGIGLIAVLIVLGLLATSSADRADADSGVTVGIDVVTTGNTATSVGSIQNCVTVAYPGPDVDVDFYIKGVTFLVAFEAYFEYDSSIVNIQDYELLFVPPTNDVTESVPDSDGVFRIGTADLGGHSGDGVLARLTIRPVGAGATLLSFPQRDISNPANGTIDRGVFLTNGPQSFIGDNGEGIYDDSGSSGDVSPGDTRITPGAGSGLSAGNVGGGDTDIGNDLVAFDASEQHDETVTANADYDDGEGIYNDMDSTGDVSVGDVRITPASGSGLKAGVVAAAADDLSNALVGFNANEKHDETVTANNTFNDRDSWFDDTVTGAVLAVGSGSGACTDDSDGDGVIDAFDNCPSTANTGQQDWNSDGEGDACDDTDGDGDMDDVDNCRTDSNPGQEDVDTDGVGDACDDDIDGDSYLNGPDNCPQDYNTGQEDMDSDGVGDACDDDIDGDEYLNDAENTIGTDPMDDCADNGSDDAWPPDFDNDTDIDIFDVLAMKPFFNSPGSNPYSNRHDLDIDSNVDIFDILQMKPVFNQNCT